jgi:hypothetical protein
MRHKFLAHYNKFNVGRARVLPGAEPVAVRGAQLLHSAGTAQGGAAQAEAGGAAPGQRLVRCHPQFLHAAAHRQGGQTQGQGNATYVKILTQFTKFKVNSNCFFLFAEKIALSSVVQYTHSPDFQS